MEKLNVVRLLNGGMSKLPPGFRFQPTDEEIVFLYLARKTFSYRLPALLIPDINNVFTFDPWDLPGNLDQDKYFFSNKEANRTGKATCSGYWKATGSVKTITCSKRMPIVGIRKSLVFYKEKHARACKTDWIMHEYCIALSKNTANNTTIQQTNNSQGSLVRIGNWTLCHVFLKKTSNSIIAQVDDENDNNHRNYDFMSDSDSCSVNSSSSPQYSDSTEVSSSTSAAETSS